MEPRANYPKVAPGALEAMLGFSVRARDFIRHMTFRCLGRVSLLLRSRTGGSSLD
jgi:hypothetical protein